MMQKVVYVTLYLALLAVTACCTVRIYAVKNRAYGTFVFLFLLYTLKF